jgi:hypothetical protein
MKLLKAALIASVLAAPVYAGNLTPPQIEPEIVTPTSSSSGGILIPLLLVVLLAAAVSSN